MILYNGRIPGNIEQEAKEKATMEDAASLLKPLPKHKTANRIFATCPKCGRADYKFNVFRRNGTIGYKCFSCGISGDLMGLMTEFGNMDYHDAILYLCDRNGIFLPNAGKPESKQDELRREERRDEVQVGAKNTVAPSDTPAVYIELDEIERCAADFDKSRLYGYFTKVLRLNADRVREVAQLYGVGAKAMPTWSDPMPAVFPYADADANICYGRISAYREDGHRFKYTDKDGRETALMKNFSTTATAAFKPLFGSHLALLPQEQGKAVVVVESEKTAMLMRMFAPQYVRLASCSMNWITTNNADEKLRAFRDRLVLLLPDRNAVAPAAGNWDDIAAVLRDLGYNAKCLSGFMRYYFNPRDTDPQEKQERVLKSDIGDYVEESLLDSRFSDVMKRSFIRVMLRDLGEAIALPHDADFITHKIKQDYDNR